MLNHLRSVVLILVGIFLFSNTQSHAASLLGVTPSNDPLIEASSVDGTFDELLDFVELSGEITSFTSGGAAVSPSPFDFLITGFPSDPADITFDAFETSSGVNSVLSGVGTDFAFDSDGMIEFLFDVVSDDSGLFGTSILVTVSDTSPFADDGFGGFVLSGSAAITTPNSAVIPLPPTLVLMLGSLFILVRLRKRQTA